MPYLTQLADVARRTGFPVIEVEDWKTRGHGPQPAVKGIVCHHTAGRNDLRVVVNGRPGLDGPLSQFWLKHDGSIYVVAAGRCWHNAPSTSENHTNSNSLGIEAENDGHEPWPAVQLRAYKALCAELCKEFKLAASRVKGHKEVQPGKPDPHTINMTTFRKDVDKLINGGVSGELPILAEGAIGYPVRTARALMWIRGYGKRDGTAEETLNWMRELEFLHEFTEFTKAFQTAKKLTADGIIGPLTWQKLEGR